MTPFFCHEPLILPGEVDIHDLHWSGEDLLAVNTRFSCLARIDHKFSFTPLWKPFFIARITPQDQCHLNGVAFENDKPKYVTALGKSDTAEGWRKSRDNGGIVLEVSSNSIVAEGLFMPHSPRIYDNKLFLLESATGHLVTIDTANGKKETVLALDGFAREWTELAIFFLSDCLYLEKKPARLRGCQSKRNPCSAVLSSCICLPQRLSRT